MDNRGVFDDCIDDCIKERLELSFERIRQMREEQSVSVTFRPFFVRVAEFIGKIKKLADDVTEGRLEQYSIEQLKELNTRLYEDILGDNYEHSFANPSYACRQLGDDYGKLCAFLYKEIRGMIVYAFEKRMHPIVIRNELFIEIYNCFEEEELPKPEEIQKILYWFVSDYSDRMTERRVMEQLIPEMSSFALDIIQKENLGDLRYLFRFGEYISDNELKIAGFLNTLPEETVQKMADTFTEGFRLGFVKSGKDLSAKKVVNIRYHLGFERVIRKAVENFAQMGLEVSVYRKSVDVVSPRIGYESAEASRQYWYDHKDDRALFLDRAYMERRLGILRTVYEKHKEQAALFAGPAVMETFGEEPFVPKVKKEVWKLDDRQQKIAVELAGASADLVNRYIKGEERSFTIIAFPIPEIGEPFEEIFREIIGVNTLDYQLYETMQQKIIDVLDQGDYVHIKGYNGNCTDLKVNLYKLKDPSRETIFENCVADVNIPVGEVFTSPVLKGTDGVLHVTDVFLDELEYKQLKLQFQDGKVAAYTCSNFEQEEDNQRYIRENLLKQHETLPMGEFAIGTNTTAYVVSRKYRLEKKLPILIAEKTGPHFAVGDTCYSREEDVRVYNPDGKEIVAKENEISARRKEDSASAYFNCHTDITIPYDELESIVVVKKDGTKTEIIKNGRFVLEGTSYLNEAFK